MEIKKSAEIFCKRENKNQEFDKRLIQEIVNAIEAGLPRREAIRLHGMSKATLVRWMSIYGSASFQTTKQRIYKPTERRSVLRAIEGGMSVKEARLSFGMKSETTIRKWIRGVEHENADLGMSKSIIMTKPGKTIINDELTAVHKALEEAQLKIKALDTLIDIAEEQFNVDIRKKPGARQSPK
jgi:transposase